jgi:hypothetical protein
LVPSVVVQIACVSPRVNSAEPWVRGRKPTIASIGRTWSVAAVDAAAVLEDRAAHDVGLDLLDQLDRDHLGLRWPSLGESFLGLGARGVERVRRADLSVSL